jgi:hypothetical protein
VPCGGPNGPGPLPPPPPPANNPPVIESITIQGTRANEPPNFADAGKSVAVSAKVHDDETALDQLQYDWSAPTGTFAGTGANVTWQAPASIEKPVDEKGVDVALTLRVIERYGPTLNFQHEVTATATLSLHDSVSEVGKMAKDFLLDFSRNDRPVDEVMRNFSAASCPDPNEGDSERRDVQNVRKNYTITAFRIGEPVVTVNFDGRCQYPDPTRRKRGDACAVVRSAWDSIDRRDNSAGSVDGNDFVAGTYSRTDRRWWLCASDYDALSTIGAVRRDFIR